MSEQRKLTEDEYLRAYALFCMAKEYYEKSRYFEESMNEVLLGVASFSHGHVSDAIVSFREMTFTKALQLDGFDVDDIPFNL